MEPDLPDPSDSSAIPALSVVMPVHNALPYLDEAVDSILNQTFRDFEFVILDDGSTDGSLETLRTWASRDSRIRLVEAPENLGPVASSECVAQQARAPIVARMDADDVSHPERLAEQFDLLRSRRDVGVVASLCDIIDAEGRIIRGPEPWRLARRSWMVPFAHGAMMYRDELFKQVGGYRRECDLWEDQDLVTRMAAVAKVMVIPRALYQVRQWATSTRSSSDLRRQEQALDLMYRSLRRLALNQDYSDVLRSRRSADERIDPRVFVSLGSLVLWSGGRPRLFRRLLRRGKLALNLRSLTALTWTFWSSLSPQTLRAFLRLLLSVRNAFATARIRSSGPVFWSQPRRHPLARYDAEKPT